MKTIMCYGDSNTWGFMPKLEPSVIETDNRYPWGVRWTSRLQISLGADYRVIEDGLNGRTTMLDCPMEDHRNGLKDIDVCLMTNKPIDLVIIMLGTNDTKIVFNMTPYVIAHGIERLIERIRTGGNGHNGTSPEILVVSPIRMGDDVEDRWLFGEFDKASVARDRQLAKFFKIAADKAGVHFLDAGAYVSADPADCIHMNADGHAKLAELLCDKVKEILG